MDYLFLRLVIVDIGLLRIGTIAEVESIMFKMKLFILHGTMDSKKV